MIKKRRRLAKRNKLKKILDRLISLSVRRKGYCEFAGKDKVKCSKQLQCMHIVGRSNMRLRWDENNLLCGCSGHHRFYTARPLDFVEVISRFWPDRMKYIMEHKNEIMKYSLEELQETIKINEKSVTLFKERP